MKRIIALCVASAISVAVHADEVSGTTEAPILRWGTYEERSQAKQEARKKLKNDLEARHAHLGELERLAVPYGGYVMASREDLLPYRFSDVSKLQSMLRDPEWSDYWIKIAAAISMVADSKAALDLIEFIKSSEAPEGYERHWNEARAAAIAALGYTLIDQDVPEVLEFIEKLDGDSYAESLKLKGAPKPEMQAYGALSLAATDDSIALLESLLSRKKAEKENRVVQALSVGGQPNEDRNDEINNEIRKLEMHLGDAKRKRAGVAPEPSNEMP